MERNLMEYGIIVTQNGKRKINPIGTQKSVQYGLVWRFLDAQIRLPQYLRNANFAELMKPIARENRA